jgi:hypothetical protein
MNEQDIMGIWLAGIIAVFGTAWAWRDINRQQRTRASEGFHRLGTFIGGIAWAFAVGAVVLFWKVKVSESADYAMRSAGILAFAVGSYWFMRAIGWVIDGFAKAKPSE